MACSEEAPVGEIIDRTERTTNLLIDKSEKLVGLDKEMIDAVDNLQVLVSQCSSKRGCERRCWCQSCPCTSEGECEPTCCGYIYCCADSSAASHECLERDEDTPCPYKEIDDQLKKIQDLSQKITDVVEGKKKTGSGEETPEEKIENIGILQIISDVIPGILKDLEINVRYPMKHCSSESWEKQDIILFKCAQAKGSTNPDGEVIRFCCDSKYIENETKKDTPFGECLEECYLEKDQKDYRDCLQSCLEIKSKTVNNEDILYCVHNLDFYCCHTSQ